MSLSHFRSIVFSASAAFLFAGIPLCAQSGQPCPRNLAGSIITQPEDLYSSVGILQVSLNYQTRIDSNGNTLYCFTAADGAQSPTLHVNPGDRLIVNFTNQLPASTSTSSMAAMPGMIVTSSSATTCGATTMTAGSANIHYHGTSTLPVCHQDEVIHTLVNPGDSFQYNVAIPDDQPPGLYWYHPHVHGISEAAVQGGASGALIVDGIEKVNPVVAGLTQQVIVLRDNPVPGNPAPGPGVPAWDLSVNYIPVPYPNFTPAVISMKPLERQFWRVVNASADTILDLQVQYDGTPQALQMVSLDGTAIGSRDGAARTLTQTDILLGPGARAEFVVTGPGTSIQKATLLTLNVNTGPNGDNDPQRPIAAIVAKAGAAAAQPIAQARVRSAAAIPLAQTAEQGHPFAGLPRMTPTLSRKLYFSDSLATSDNPTAPNNFFITVDGQTPAVFNPNNPPAIETTQGSVEDWTIENRALQTHVFHIHQLHFVVTAVNGVAISGGPYVDTVQIPFWSGTGPYPSVTVRMDFRGPTIGDFVFHCHILLHEDLGMMAIIRVIGR